MKRYINFENIIKGFIVGIIVGFIMQACVLHAGTDQSVFKKIQDRK